VLGFGFARLGELDIAIGFMEMERGDAGICEKGERSWLGGGLPEKEIQEMSDR
jgi:hypothetical protein